MPELPEVEYVLRRLRPVMTGARFERVQARRPDLRFPLGPDFAARLEGQTVRALRRRAKYLVAELASGDVLLMHLGMSGWFRVERALDAAALEPHDHVVFEMSGGSAVVFNDPRRFGSMKIVRAASLAGDPTLRVLGPEPLGRAFTAAAMAEVLARRRRTTLKAALSDQRIVAGLGNIYVCEALHRARLSPKRAAATLVTRAGAPRPRLIALVDAVRSVLREAIANRHRVSAGDRFRVYDREGRRCPRRGCRGTIGRIVQAGRSTFYCPRCQR